MQLYGEKPNVGLVITTYSALPYIHLQMEARRRYYPHVPCLVTDDGSRDTEKLADLCGSYGVEFQSSSKNHGHHLGDVAGIYNGLLWGEKRKLDLVVKFSRRFIPLHDWTEDLLELAARTQSPTFSNICKNLNWGFRTECMGMHVTSWQHAKELFAAEIGTKSSTFCEGFVHNCARKVAQQIGYRCGHEYWCDGYARWSIMGDNRIVRQPLLLWHHFAKEDEYHGLSKLWKLPYDKKEFFAPHLFA